MSLVLFLFFLLPPPPNKCQTVLVLQSIFPFKEISPGFNTPPNDVLYVNKSPRHFAAIVSIATVHVYIDTNHQFKFLFTWIFALFLCTRNGQSIKKKKTKREKTGIQAIKCRVKYDPGAWGWWRNIFRDFSFGDDEKRCRCSSLYYNNKKINK